MMTFIIVIHVIASALLIILVLIQRGRGSGLVESFAGVESMFGTKTSAFLTRTTTICAVIFFLTCLTLAILSVRQSKSLLANVKPAVSQKAEKVPNQESISVQTVAEESKPVQGAAE
jgi:preprotein translocase subunit SecG